jgi:hypothetical protein
MAKAQDAFTGFAWRYWLQIIGQRTAGRDLRNELERRI